MNPPSRKVPPKSAYAAYWGRVSELLTFDPKLKGKAISFGNTSVDGIGMVLQLMEALDGPWDRVSAKDSNWAWRQAPRGTSENNQSEEVRLERAIVQRGGPKTWTYQMSTASGLLGAHADKRRSIDLVHCSGGAHYTFIELKCDADNPVYAAFELLGYGLAYLQARCHATWPPTRQPSVMNATRIDLRVLAPRDWYSYNERGGYAHDPFVKAINEGLTDLLHQRLPALSMRLNFASFDPCPEKDDGDRITRTADTIVALMQD